MKKWCIEIMDEISFTWMKNVNICYVGIEANLDYSSILGLKNWKKCKFKGRTLGGLY
jgi:hypothetical protein